MQFPWSRTRMDEVYAHLAMRVFATSMIGVFVPIYLWTLNFSPAEIGIFMIHFYGIVFLLSPFSAILSGKLGCARQMMLFAPIQGLYYFLLLSLPIERVFFFPAALIGGASIAIYWIPLNAIVVNSLTSKKEGKQIAYIMAIPRIVSICAPLAAGILLTTVGFTSFFALAILLIAVSVFPLFLSPEVRFPMEFRMRLPKRICVQQAIFGVCDVTELLAWPLWLFSQFNDLVAVGIAASLQGVGIVVFTILFGGVSDRFPRRWVMRIAGVCYAAVWVGRSLAPSPLALYALSFLGGAAVTFFETSIFPQFVDTAKGRLVLGRLLGRELWIFFGRIFALLAFVLFTSPATAFLIAAIACIFLLVA